jgi:hypothetical protein
MKVLRLNGDQIAALLAQPESGMGFQIVEVEVAYSQRSEPWLAFNAELAIAFDSPQDRVSWSETRNAGSIEWLRSQAVDPGTLYRQPRVVVTRSGVGLQAVTWGAASGLAPAPLSLIKQSSTVAGMGYRRFSAFPNDKRMNPATGAFLAGTYATTANDEPMAPTGFGAVGRYALPNIMPASFVHALTSPWGATIHSGTVAPAYGQSGGGVEVYFPNGVSNSTGLKPPRQIPDE